MEIAMDMNRKWAAREREGEHLRCGVGSRWLPF
jgi:hypothetical protein